MSSSEGPSGTTLLRTAATPWRWILSSGGSRLCIAARNTCSSSDASCAATAAVACMPSASPAKEACLLCELLSALRPERPLILLPSPWSALLSPALPSSPASRNVVYVWRTFLSARPEKQEASASATVRLPCNEPGVPTWTSTDFFATKRAHASARAEVSTEETPRMRGGLCGPAAWAALSAEEDAE